MRARLLLRTACNCLLWISPHRGVGNGQCSASCRAAVDFAKRDHLGAFDEIRYHG